MAVAAAMQELSIVDRESVDVEVIQEPKGLLGGSGKDAIVRVKPRTRSEPQAPASPRRRGRGRRPSSSQATGPGVAARSRPPGSRTGGNGQGGRARAQTSVRKDRTNVRLARREPLENPADRDHRAVGRQMTGTGVETPAIIRVVPLAHHERERQG